MNKILEHFKTNWYKYGFETLVVIVGVLIAFSLNNWNEVRKADVNKARLLQSLIAEYEYNLAAIDLTSFADSIVLESIVKLMARMNSANDDSLNYLVGGSLVNSSFDPVNGALRSAISSGDIHLINNKDLLTSLFAWEDLMDDLNEEQLLLRDEQWKMMERFTQEYRVADAIGEFSVAFPEITGSLPMSKFNTENTLLANPAFESNLHKRFHLVTTKISEMKMVRGSNEKILNLLKAEAK